MVGREDPRYSPSLDDRPVGRVRHAVAMVFIARRADGHQSLAFARYTGIVGATSFRIRGVPRAKVPPAPR
jgi:hypothetical protein